MHKAKACIQLMIVGILTGALLMPLALLAQQSTVGLSVASTISVADPEVAYGDIILFDPTSNLFRRSNGVNDPRIHGVTVEEPALLLETDPLFIPVVESGDTYVNVVLENGFIQAGDAITTSSTPGKGMRADDSHRYIVGYALEDLADDEEEDLSVLVAVGQKRIIVDESSSSGGEVIVGISPEEEVRSQRMMVKFSLAAIVALGSIALVFITFISSVRQGVISIGRNPLAKSSIRSMVIVNIVLSVIVAILGIFFAISLLIVPI